MQDWLACKHRTPDEPFPFHVPGLTFGSFYLPSRSETQSVILVDLMDTMMARASTLISELACPKQTSGYRGNFQSFGGVSLVIVPDLALKVIRIREDEVSRRVSTLKQSLVQSGSSREEATQELRAIAPMDLDAAEPRESV
ncbi:hypothetical protein GGR56DRAFT_661106 [Xylariaceae sp. FL0804]|nr:hypothetical protein GGR56DRAFT_661106 [Xylariaceae sp. FL0804]